MPTVVIPPPYRGPTAGAESVRVEASTVRAAIEAVEARHPGFATQVFDASGEPHKFVKLFVNGDQAEPETAIADVDEVEVVAAIAGG